MTIELTKKEIKALKKLRHEIHMMGPLGTIKDMFTRSEAFGDNVAVVEKIKKQPVAYTVKEFHDKGLKVGLWTANDILALNYCLALGVDYIESDVF